MGTIINTPQGSYHLPSYEQQKKKKKVVNSRIWVGGAFLIMAVFASIYPSNWVLIPLWLAVGAIFILLINNWFLIKIHKV